MSRKAEGKSNISRYEDKAQKGANVRINIPVSSGLSGHLGSRNHGHRWFLVNVF